MPTLVIGTHIHVNMLTQMHIWYTSIGIILNYCVDTSFDISISVSREVYFRREGTLWLAAAYWCWGPHLNIKGKNWASAFITFCFLSACLMTLSSRVHHHHVCYPTQMNHNKPFSSLFLLLYIFSQHWEKKNQQLREIQEKRNILISRGGYS